MFYLNMSMNFPVFSLQQSVGSYPAYCKLRLFTALVENIGVEPMTSCVQGRRSSQLS